MDIKIEKKQIMEEIGKLVSTLRNSVFLNASNKAKGLFGCVDNRKRVGSFIVDDILAIAGLMLSCSP